MKGIEKTVHGIKIQIGLRKAHLDRLKKRYPDKDYNYQQGIIDKLELKLKRILNMPTRIF